MAWTDREYVDTSQDVSLLVQQAPQHLQQIRLLLEWLCRF